MEVTFHEYLKMLIGRSGVLHHDVSKGDTVTPFPLPLPPHVEGGSSWPVVSVSPSVHNGAVLDDVRTSRVILLITNGIHEKCRPITVLNKSFIAVNSHYFLIAFLPINHTFDSCIDIGGVILRSNETILNKSIAMWVNSITICSPGENLDPTDCCMFLRVKLTIHCYGMICGISKSYSLNFHIVTTPYKNWPNRVKIKNVKLKP